MTRIEIDKQLRDIVSEMLGVEPDFADWSVFTRDLDADSLDLVDLADEVSAVFSPLLGDDISAQIEALMENDNPPSYKDLLDLLDRQKGPAV